jgi:DNA modification methylase
LLGKSLGELRNDDARDLAKSVEPSSIDVTITSPPYYNLKDYNDKRQIGLGQDFEHYKDDLKTIFRDIYAATKNTGSLWIIVDNLRINGKLVLLPYEMAEWAKSAGWILQDVLVWDKGKTRPVNRRLGLRKVYENILVFSKQESFKCHSERLRSYDLSRWWVKWPERYKSTGKIPTDIWSFQIPTQGNWSKWQLFRDEKLHECPFPPKLVERILLLATDEGDLVLDPFAGSGMTLAVADAMKRRFIGFEINETYRNNFWNQVLPVIRRWSQEEIAEDIHSHGMQDNLEKLKKLKYARLLTQRLASQLQGLTLVSTFVLDKPPEKLEIFLLYDDSTSPLDAQPGENIQNQVETKVKEILARTELKTFHVEAAVHPLPVKDFVKTNAESLLSEELWLYKRHHMFESRIKFEDWTRKYSDDQWKDKFFVKNTPPLLSNIGIYLKDLTRDKTSDGKDLSPAA